jgi:hypothetical protein
VDASLIELMTDAEVGVRRSSRLASKPGKDYKETRGRKPKGVDLNDPLERVESEDDELDETVRVEVLKNTGKVKEQAKPAEHLLRTVGDQDGPFSECLKGRYEEDKAFKPILDNPENFANFEIEDGLAPFRSEGLRRQFSTGKSTANQ